MIENIFQFLVTLFKYCKFQDSWFYTRWNHRKVDDYLLKKHGSLKDRRMRIEGNGVARRNGERSTRRPNFRPSKERGGKSEIGCPAGPRELELVEGRKSRGGRGLAMQIVRRRVCAAKLRTSSANTFLRPGIASSFTNRSNTNPWIWMFSRAIIDSFDHRPRFA